MSERRKIRTIDWVIWTVLPLMSIPAVVGAVGYAIGYERGKEKEKKFYQPVVEAYSSDNERLRNLNKIYEGILDEYNIVPEEYERYLDEQRFQEEMRKFQLRRNDSITL